MPDENTPDFDSMSPEELMAWMETLAERQGATEGFTTDKRVEISEVDPNSVEVEDNYIPYGMSAEEWAKRKAKEEEEKAARLAAKKQQPSTQQPVSAQPAPETEPEPAPAASQPADSGELPDFDSMTPEELQAWMETLAERQGATEGFTTDKRVEIAEIDPDSVQVEDNYIPYGMSEEEWAKRKAKEEEEKAARLAAKKQQPPQQPAPAQQEDAQPIFDLPSLEDVETTQSTAAAPTGEPDELDWLAGLAQVEEDVDFPEMDLSSLGDELSSLDLGELEIEGLNTQDTDPLEWLDGLVEEQGTVFDLPKDAAPAFTPPEPDMIDETEGEDTIEWLESLAKRQGVSEDELMTDASIELPDLSAKNEIDNLFADNETDADTLDIMDASDPGAWLDQLAESQARTPTPPKPKDIIEDLNRGVAGNDPDAMKGWMDALLEEGARRNVPDYIDDEEDEDTPLEANIPDWLKEQVGTPPPELFGTAQNPDEIVADLGLDEEAIDVPPDLPDWLAEPIEDGLPESQQGLPDWLATDIEVPQEQPDIPDWLQEATSEEEDLAAVFADDDADMDVHDSWVEAFELERKMQMAGLKEIPEEWFEEDITGEIEEEIVAATSGLSPANLPDEETLPSGELEAVPDWLSENVPSSLDTQEDLAAADMPDWLKSEISSDTAEVSEIPDWLSDVPVDNAADIPDWLVETVEEQAVPSTPEPVTPPPKPTASPAPVPVSNIDVNAVMQEARTKLASGDLDTALQGFEAVIRANQHLEVIVQDLSKAAGDETHKKNPALYRVLGDALMRQGKLQEALNTYRKALTLL
ncbi:MAG: tetratricopeptide repeat protein [Chloroflexi bacterium]|nr:MAG: tetratricopeptide repeat protein [Chloroflexota bacterium]